MNFDADADEHERFAEGAGVDGSANAAASGSGAQYPPDEELDVRPIHSQPVILLKLPDYVTSQWAQVKQRGVELGKMRVYDPIPGSGGKHEHEFSFTFPPGPSSSSTPARTLTFSSTMIHGAERGKNRKYLMKEKDRVYDFSGKSRQHGHPRIFAAVNLEHNLLPKSTPGDQALFKELVEIEARRAEEQVKKTRVLSAAEQRDIKRSHAVFKAPPRSAAFGKPAKRDNFVRTDKSVLIDTMLQSCFKEYRYWSLKGMAERLQQPTSFVKEVLAEIAEYQAGGTYSGTWRLQERFQRSRGGDVTPSEQPKELAPEDVKPTAEQLADLERRQREADLAKDDFEEDDEDDEDEDMEEVA